MSVNSDTSVVICAYTEERWSDTLAAVDSVLKSEPQPGEIILVIDHNRALYDRFTKHYHGFEQVRIIENQYTQGLSGARNSGIVAARGQYIGFLDDDAVADKDWLSGLTTWCQDQSVMGAGGWINPLWEGPQPTWFPAEFYWVFGCSYTGMPTDVMPVRNLLGGCMIISRDTFESVGGFRTGIGRVGEIPLGCEETELCIRARQANPGKTFMHDPRVAISHRVPAKRTTWAYFKSRCYNEGLSKALLSKLVGADAGLATERTYSLKVLPKGVLKGVADALFRADLSGLGRALAIMVGFTWTVAGFLIGQMTISREAAQKEVAVDMLGS